MDTKGEWKVDPHSYDSAQMVVTTDGKLIANCFKSKANAHLIAAAPALSEALKVASEVIQEYIKEADILCDHSVGVCACPFFSRIDCIQEALAQAEGR